MCACYSFYTNLYVLISAKTCFTVKTTAQAARVITSGYEAPFSRCCVCGGFNGFFELFFYLGLNDCTENIFDDYKYKN